MVEQSYIYNVLASWSYPAFSLSGIGWELKEAKLKSNHTYLSLDPYRSQLYSVMLCLRSKIQQTKKLVTSQRFVFLFLFGLVWQCSSVQKKYNKVDSKSWLLATYLQK